MRSASYKYASKNDFSKKGDRAVSNADWKVKFPEAHVVVLPRTDSDHNPILIYFADYISNCRQNRPPFRYQAAWLNHDQFYNI